MMIFKLLLLSAFFLHRQPEPLPRAAACRRSFDPAASSAACTPWPDKMRALYELMHASGAPGCERALPAAERWRCIFANESGARLDGGVPLFLVNSAHDSWCCLLDGHLLDTSSTPLRLLLSHRP